MERTRKEDLTPDDFPPGEPVLKLKRGMWYRPNRREYMWYRPNNRGYTSSLIHAGLYDRAEALGDCFTSEGQNGNYDVFAIPLRMEVHNSEWRDRETVVVAMRRLNLFHDYLVTKEEIDRIPQRYRTKGYVDEGYWDARDIRNDLFSGELQAGGYPIIDEEGNEFCPEPAFSPEVEHRKSYYCGWADACRYFRKKLDEKLGLKENE